MIKQKQVAEPINSILLLSPDTRNSVTISKEKEGNKILPVLTVVPYEEARELN